MRQLLPLLLGDAGLLALAGLGMLVWLPASWRSRMLPALLTLGAIVWVVALHVTGLVVGVRVGLWIVAGVAAVSIAVRSWRVRWWRGLQTKRYLVAGLIVGAVPVLLALGPARDVGATVVQPSPNNDAYEYVAVSDWLFDHPVLQAPPGLAEPPAWGKINMHLNTGLRVGQELYEAAIAGALRRDPIQTWYVVTAGWLLLLPGAVLAAFDTLRMRRLTGLIAGTVAGFSALVVGQVLNSNSDAALGITIAPLTVALIARYVDDRSELEAGSGLDPPPIWLPAAGAAAVSAVYTEYLPLLIPALMLFVLVRPLRRVPRAVLAGASVLALAVVIGALAWYRSALSFLTTATTNSPIPSPYLDHAGSVAGRVLGFVSYDQVIRASNWKVVLFVIVGVLGVGLAVTLAPARRLFACVLIACLGIIVALSTPIHYFPYAQNRAVVVTVPLVLVMAVAGFGALLPRLASVRIPRPALAGVLVVLLGAGALFIGLDVRTTNAMARYDISHRTVDGSFQTMSDWAHRVGGPDGANVSVLVPNHFDQVWSMYYLRDLHRANYPFLYSDYTNIPSLQFDDGRLRRYAVVGTDAFVDAAPGVVVGRTSRFLLLDTSRGSAAVAFGIASVEPIDQKGAQLTQWMQDDPSLMVAHTPDVQQARLTLVANPAAGPSMPLKAAVGGGQTTALDVGTAARAYTVPLASPSGQTVQTVVLDTQRPGRPITPADPRPFTVAIEGARP